MELEWPEQEEPEYPEYDQSESEDQPLSEEKRAQHSREEKEYDTFINRLTPCYNCKATNPRVDMINMVGVFKETLCSPDTSAQRHFTFTTETQASEGGGRSTKYVGKHDTLEIGPVCGPCAFTWPGAWVRSSHFYISRAMRASAPLVGHVAPLVTLVVEYCGTIAPEHDEQIAFRGYSEEENIATGVLDFQALSSVG